VVWRISYLPMTDYDEVKYKYYTILCSEILHNFVADRMLRMNKRFIISNFEIKLRRVNE
jgi:hypothetical protein